MDTLQQVQWHQTLLSLGKTVVLKKVLSEEDQSYINKQIFSFEQHFKPYNPRKLGYNRYGLSITSLDGGFSGVPNLDSLREYNKEHNTNLSENDFREWTPFFKTCTALQDITAPFHKYMGRSHILRLNKGGFSPFHRDSITLIPESFRLLISFSHFDRFVFLLDNERVYFEPGRLYFVNTRLTHGLFSFSDKSDLAVFNIDLCEGSVRAVISHLAFK